MAPAVADRRCGTAVLPVRSLTGVGADDWGSFAAGLDANLPDSASQTRAAKAAVSVFAAREDWMAG